MKIGACLQKVYMNGSPTIFSNHETKKGHIFFAESAFFKVDKEMVVL